MNDTQHLISLLQKQKKYYERMLELSQKEYEKLLNQRPLEEITPLIKQRKVLLECIQDQELPLQQAKKKCFSDKASPMPQEVNLSLKDLDSILQTLLSVDAENHTLMEKFLSRLKEKQASH